MHVMGCLIVDLWGWWKPDLWCWVMGARGGLQRG